MPRSTQNKPNLLWLPLVIAVAVVLGIFIGNRFSSRKYAADNDRKINSILNLIASEYVDTVNLHDLIEKSIPSLLSNLDPHTVYFSRDDLKATNDDLNGSFSGIGISFMINNDTITVVEVIPGGPSATVGILAGDRIVTINDSTFAGQGVSDTDVRKHLRGDKGTLVKLGIKRSTSPKLLTFTVKRGDIPVNTVDAAYMLDKTTGYIKVNQFGRNTYREFMTGMHELDSLGARRYILDLRGNGGGFMEMAILMANEFLPENQPIVFTKGRYKRNDSQVWSDGNGQYQRAELVVLIDEFSASASEIVAGAMQDNDRGLVVGCRSFGKGLVQNQLVLPDSSAIRLTIARYYTPSGRCIQKDYGKGENAYAHELVDRYEHGELYSRDSIKIDHSQIFKTMHGRTVYGGGGIVPDVFVAHDTTGLTSYYLEIFNAGLLQKYAFDYVDNNRETLSRLTDYKQFLRTLPPDETVLRGFVDYASNHNVPARWYYINESQSRILTQLKALIARDVFGNKAYYPIFNRNDKTIQAALKALNRHKAAFPIVEQ